MGLQENILDLFIAYLFYVADLDCMQSQSHILMPLVYWWLLYRDQTVQKTILKKLKQWA